MNVTKGIENHEKPHRYFSHHLFGTCDKSAPPQENSPAAVSSARTTAATVKGTIHVSGSSALQPLVNAAKEKFETQNKSLSVEVSAGGSKKGISDVASGAVDIGDSDIFASGETNGGLVDHKVAVVGFAAMANKRCF